MGSQVKITLLGTGGPDPSLKRMGSGYLLELGEDLILFDHGPGAHHRFLEAGYKSVDVTHLFFTHLHYDHCCDFSRLFLNRWDQGAHFTDPLKIYGPPGIQEMTIKLFGQEGVFAPDLRARTEHQMSIEIFEERGGVSPRPWPVIDVTELTGNMAVENKDWKLTFCKVPHVNPYLVCHGYRLETKDGVFVYSGDAGPCASMRELANGADVLIHMCGNITGEEASDIAASSNMPHKELAQLARDAEVKTLIPTHINPKMDAQSERLISEMREIYDGNLLLAEDLLEITI